MKKSSLIIRISKIVAIYFVIAISITGCKNEDPIKIEEPIEEPIEEIEYNSVFTVEKNEASWNVSRMWANTNSFGGFNIGATSETPNGIESFSLDIKKSDIVIGEKLELFTSNWELLIAGDIGANNYLQYDSTSENYLTINNLDTINHIIKGEFEVILIRDSRLTSNKEFMKFKKGKFDIRYKYIE